MKTLAIVSSYDESCGNAAFAKILHDSIEQYAACQVEVLPLNLRILQDTESMIRRAGDIHIQELCKSLKNFDYVNIQIEPCLYGFLHQDIYRRIQQLIDANPNTTVTLHSPRLVSADFTLYNALRVMINQGLHNGVRQFIYYFRNPIILNKKIIRYAIKRRRRLIVHTLRAKEQINYIFNYKNIDAHPLRIVPDNFISQNTFLEKLKQSLSLKDRDVLIGMFGYISPYKGHLDAINALRYLPKNFKLLIFGRQHPQSIKNQEKMDKYLNSVLKMVTKNPDEELSGRVLFVGELSDEEFLNMAANVAVIWLPYYENGQDGSGIASICLELCPRVLCSASFAFDELFRLIPYNNYLRFDIGNSLEIANKTKIILQQANPISNVNSPYTIKTQAEIYTKGFVR